MTRSRRIILFILLGLVVYFFIIAVFGVIFQQTHSLYYSGIHPRVVESYFDCFYFSLVSFQTIGYGDIFPSLPIAKKLIFAESIFSTIFFAIFSGFLVYFFIRRSKDVFLSENCYIRFVNNKFWFSIRVGNKGGEVLDCKAVIEFLRINNAQVRVTDIKLVKETSVIEKTWFVDFKLSEPANEGALRKLQSIARGNEDLLMRCVFSGIDNRSGSPIVIIRYYHTADLKFGGRYYDVHSWDIETNEKKNFNWGNFNKINELTAQEIESFKSM